MALQANLVDLVIPQTTHFTSCGYGHNVKFWTALLFLKGEMHKKAY